jgi:hypothetical protein
LASAGGRPNATEERNELASQLNAKDLQQGQQLSAAWKVGTLIPEPKYQAAASKRTTPAAAAPPSGNVASAASAGPYPAQPAKRPGVVSCNTNCRNGDCYRTYEDGRKVHFQATQKWNPFENRFDWDSGSC